MIVQHPVVPPAPQRPARSDVVFRLGASSFYIWFILVVATSPVSNQRSSWWTWFIGISALLPCTMLMSALMTLKACRQDRY
jgi:hypothetical protein